MDSEVVFGADFDRGVYVSGVGEEVEEGDDGAVAAVFDGDDGVGYP